MAVSLGGLIEKLQPWNQPRSSQISQTQSSTTIYCRFPMLDMASRYTVLQDSEHADGDARQRGAKDTDKTGSYIEESWPFSDRRPVVSLDIELLSFANWASIGSAETRRTTMHFACPELSRNCGIHLVHCIPLVHSPAECTVESNSSQRMDDEIHRRCCCRTSNLSDNASWHCDVYARGTCS